MRATPGATYNYSSMLRFLNCFYICLDISSCVAFMRDVFSEEGKISKDRCFTGKLEMGKKKTLNQVSSQLIVSYS